MADLRAQAKADVRRLTREFLSTVDEAWGRLTRAQEQLVADYPSLGPAALAGRERELERIAAEVADAVNDAAKDQIRRALEGAFELGATRTAVTLGRDDILDITGSDLLRAALSDTYSDILTATRHVQRTTKELVRALAREAASQRVQGGSTATDMARALAKRLSEEGVSAIVYRDGSRHGLDDYADMLLRTKTAEIYQVGGFEQARDFGIGFMEILDNPSCGLSFHDDPTLANGLILPISEAEKYPISHPRCVRVTIARPDILTADQARAAKRSTTAGQDDDQRGVEQVRLSAAARKAERRRAARRRAGLIDTGAGAAVSPAARRAATRVARRQATT